MSDKAKAKGRANARGQNKEKVFVNEATGEQRVGTMNDYHTSLKRDGFRPLDDEAAVDEAPAEDVAVVTQEPIEDVEGEAQG
jgi:hypothetical protein